MTRATTEAATNAARYHAIRAYQMDPKSEAAVLAAVKAEGFEAGRCKRGGLLIAKKGLMVRLTDEPGAPPLCPKDVADLIVSCAQQASRDPQRKTAQLRQQ